MSEFNANKLNPDNINGGKKFNKGDGFSANDLNSVVEGILYSETQGGGSNVDLAEYQKKTDEGLLTTDKTIVGAINEINKKVGQGGSNITVDNELNAESENPVQNKVITEALGGKVDTIPNNTSIDKVYAVNRNGVYLSGMIKDTPLIGYIPQFSARKTLSTETATKDLECVNLKQLKEYVSSRTGVSANTLYYHIFFGQLNNGSSFQFEVYSNRSEIDIGDNYLKLHLPLGEEMNKDVFNVHHIANSYGGNGTINPTIEYEVVGVVEGSDPVTTIYRITKIGNFDFSMVSEISLVSTGEV